MGITGHGEPLGSADWCASVDTRYLAKQLVSLSLLVVMLMASAAFSLLSGCSQDRVPPELDSPENKMKSAMYQQIENNDKEWQKKFTDQRNIYENEMEQVKAQHRKELGEEKASLKDELSEARKENGALKAEAAELRGQIDDRWASQTVVLFVVIALLVAGLVGFFIGLVIGVKPGEALKRKPQGVVIDVEGKTLDVEKNQ